jgi:SPOR domain
MNARVILGLCLVVLLAACQPVPRPFQGAGPPDPRILRAPDFGGVVVRPVRDAPEPSATLLARAMATALNAAQIPATNGAPNQRSLLLDGAVIDTGRNAHILWVLRGADGAAMAERRQEIEGMPILPWARGEDWLMRELAEDIAPQFIAMLGVPQTTRPNAVVRLLPVTGAPGDGNQALSAAMSGALRIEEVAIAALPDQRAVGVGGQVVLEAGPPGTERIVILWIMTDPVGAEIGRITQSNAIQAGSLSGPWGQTAEIVAMAAAPAIADLARRVAANESARAPAAAALPQTAPRVPDGQAAGATFRLHLGTQPNREQAQFAAEELKQRFPQLLRNVTLSVVAAATDRGSVYRIQSGPVRDQIAAQELCRQFRSEGQDCTVLGF